MIPERPSITALFATPLVVSSIATEDGLIGDLIATIRRQRLANPAAAAGYAWRSPDDLTGWGAACVNRLARLLVMAAEQVSLDVGRVDEARYDWVPSLRAHIVRDHERIDIAGRPDAFWSGLCCLDDGYGARRDVSQAGEIDIADPRLPATLMEAPQLRLRLSLDQPGMTYRESARLRPATGQLLLYPSWLQVQQRPLRGTLERIWISFDLIARRRPGDLNPA